MKALILVGLLCTSSAFATVECLDSGLSTNGTWTTATVSGLSTKICSGSTRPVYYRVTRGAATDANARTELNQVFDDAWLGDTVMLNAGDVWNVESGNSLYVYGRPNGTGYLTITTTEYAKLPAEGTRITPMYSALMPILQTANNNTPILWLMGSASAAKHIKIRGIRFRPKPGASADVTSAFILMSHPQTSYDTAKNVWVGSASSKEAYTTRALTYPIGHTGPIEVSRGTGFVAGRRVNAPFYNGPIYTIASADYSGAQHTVTFVEPLTATLPVNSGIVSEVLPETQPDDIIVSQCILHNPYYAASVGIGVAMEASNAYLKDSFLQGGIHLNQSGEKQLVMSIAGGGPLYILNNFMDGGTETLMFGGSFSVTNQQVTGGDIRFNYFGHTPERDNHYLWNHVLPSQTYPRLSFMSLPGLPAHSPKFIMAGRHLQNAISSNGVRYRAMTSGVTDDSLPTYSTVQGTEFYKVDANRTNPAIYGTTWCNGAWNNGDGVCFKIFSNTLRPQIKNNFELKQGTDITLRYNVIDHYDALYGTQSNGNQYAIINIKGNSANWITDACQKGLSYPDCSRQFVENFVMENNIIRNYSGGMVLAGTLVSTPPVGRGNGRTVRNNMWIQSANPAVDTGYSGYLHLYVGENTTHVWTTTLAAYSVGHTGPIQVADASVFSVGSTIISPLITGNTNSRTVTAIDTVSTPNTITLSSALGFAIPSGSYVYDNITMPISDVRIENNTFYSPFVRPTGQYGIQFHSIGTTTSYYEGTRTWKGNVHVRAGAIAGGGSFVKGSSTTSLDGGAFLTDTFPRTSTGGVYNSGVVLGAANVTPTNWPTLYPTYTGCSGTAKCLSGAADDGTLATMWDTLMSRRPSRIGNTDGLLTVKSTPTYTSGAKVRASLDAAGTPGADPAELPEIRDLVISTAQTKAVAMFTLTNPIAHIPAVLEVHVAPDFEGNYWGKTQGDNIWGLTGTEKPYWHGEDALYAGEQADMSTNYGKESSAHARNMSVGNRRMIRIEGLTANHTYYYRLHAGGDVRRGMFTTAPTAVATRTPSTPQVGSMTYATDYNGALVSPSSPTCASSRCTASVPADSIVYWSSGVVAAVP